MVLGVVVIATFFLHETFTVHKSVLCLAPADPGQHHAEVGSGPQLKTDGLFLHSQDVLRW